MATVIGMSSIISGLNANIASQIQDLGSNLVFIQRIPPTFSGRVPPEMFSRKKLTLEDAEAIGELPLVQAISPVLQYANFNASSKSFSVRYRDHSAKNTIFIGATPEVATVMNLHITAGRWINEADHTHNSNVVVLGHDTADTIFPANVDPMDKEVEIEGQPFRVIGVLEKRKDVLQGGSNPNDNVAEMPDRHLLARASRTKGFHVRNQDRLSGGHAARDWTDRGLLRLRRGVAPNKEDDFAISTQDTFTDFWNQISGGVFTVMLAISSIALLVGGVGVMNIMLVSVTERTREIGVRKAIGATQRNILMQFLFEAMVLTAAGGILGIGSGALIAESIRSCTLPAGHRFTVLGRCWILGFGGTGLIFGLYPAYRAAC